MSSLPLVGVVANVDEYSPATALIFVFNLIVGTGALALPSAFGGAGWLLGLVVIMLLAFASYVTTTFVVEAMSAANAVSRWQQYQRLKRVGPPTPVLPRFTRSRTSTLHSHVDVFEDEEHDDKSLDTLEGSVHEEEAPLIAERDRPSCRCQTPPLVETQYAITERIEMGQMASMFFQPWGRTLFYICIIIYLYGDLAIYCAAVAKSLRDICCTYSLQNDSSELGISSVIGGNNSTLSDLSPCWTDSAVTRMGAYRLFLAIFVGCLGPFVFFNVQKTKYLQIITSAMRWIAFSIMIALACVRLANGTATGHPSAATFSGLPNLFGVCIYSFMCHHSLPSLVTPMAKKDRLSSLLAVDYLLIAAFYLLLAFTGIFAFDHLNDLYTLNFEPDHSDPDRFNPLIVSVQYFLALFPVFTLSASFPIIGITLRNNLRALFLSDVEPESRTKLRWFARNVAFPLLAILPPAIISFSTENVKLLVGVTGSYAGAGVQYLIPAALVFCGRKTVGSILDGPNPHTSPFRHPVWLILLVGWAAICIVFVSVDHILSATA